MRCRGRNFPGSLPVAAASAARRSVSRIAALFSLVFLFSLSALAQEARWSELTNEVFRLLTGGKNAEAIPVAAEAARVAESTFGPNDPRVASVLGLLATLYRIQGEYREVEPLMKQVLAIRQKTLRPGDYQITTSMKDLANLYKSQGRYGDAEALLKQAIAIQKKALRSRPDTTMAQLLSSLGMVYEDQLRYEDAEPLFDQALEIRQKLLEPYDPELAASLDNLARLYEAQARYGDAESLNKQAIKIFRKKLGPHHISVATSTNNLAALYQAQGKHKKAEKLYKQAIAIYESGPGRDSSSMGTCLQNLGLLYYAMGRPSDSQSNFDLALENVTVDFEQQFTYMNENDRLAFLGTFRGVIAGYVSFASAYHNENTKLAGRVYDLLLWEKGLVAGSVASQRKLLVDNGDSQPLKLFDQLTAKRNQYAALAAAQPDDPDQWRKDLNQKKQEEKELEEQLVRRSAAFAESRRLARPSWQDVQKALGKDEAAVEVVRFEFHDGRKWTGKNKYAALVLTQASKSGPVFVDLGSAGTLESALQPAYYQKIALTSLEATRLATADSTNDALAFYASFWKPLEPALGSATRIYVSTDGVLNQVALGLIPTPRGNLMKSYDLQFLNRTTDLLQPVVVHSNQTAVLFANPYFNILEADYRKALAELRAGERVSQTPSVPSLSENGATLGTLLDQASTRTLETGLQSDVIPLLKQRGWTVEPYFEYNALVEAVEQVQAPRLLHIGTHGDFLPDPAAKMANPGESSTSPALISDPMLRSRLYFAGAQHTLDGKALPADLSDGILTAFQASTLNLRGTELVVLSACETGRGEQQDGEGVFGLRRALQEAGAESVLMTLWEVPATETQELLSDFYRHWLADGMDKHQALLAAQENEQKIVQKRYGSDQPYYWGAFILVGR